MRRTLAVAIPLLAVALLACGNRKKKCLETCEQHTAVSLQSCATLEGQAKEMCDDTIKESITECKKICEESY